MRIIIVEDEIKIREGMRKMISSQTRHMIAGEAADGEEGLEVIRRFKPDLVITDIRMPKMNGIEMIRQLTDEKVAAHFVILSGYSEFEYAKKAIQYGVEDYLLKPLAAEDVQEMLAKIEDKITEEKRRSHGLAESTLKSVLFSYEKENAQNRIRIQQDCGLEPGISCCMMAGYIGAARAGYQLEVENGMIELKNKYGDFKIYLIYYENTQTFYCLAAVKSQNSEKMKHFERSFYNQLVSQHQNEKEYAVWALEEFSDTWIGEVGEDLRRYLSYALVLKEKGFITHDVIAEYQAEKYEYPKDISIRLKNAFCQEKGDAIAEAAKEFFDYMKKHRFEPADIRNAFIKSYYMVLDTFRELNQIQYKQLINASILRQLEESYTFQELEAAFEDIEKIATGLKMQREDISNYVIKKAINYIREHYQEGLTLEEVSRKLDITPEYLSTLFNREVGINFSTFLKRFRLSHAKRMLKGSDMKIYEIAEAIGYSDSKYFNRVFKEEEGISPGEYRQMN